LQILIQAILVLVKTAENYFLLYGESIRKNYHRYRALQHLNEVFMKLFLSVLFVFISSILFFSCAFAPINNQYEKAGTLKEGNAEFSGSFTGYGIAGAGGSLSTNNNFGFRAGYGLTDKFDLKLRYEHLITTNSFEDEFSDGEVKGTNYFSLVPKFSLVPNKLALFVPLSHYSFKEEIDGKESKGSMNSIAPQILYTITNSKNKIDFSFGMKADYLFGDDGGGVLFGTTVGAGFSSDLNKWAIRPEVGAMFTGGAAAFVSYGVGFQYLLTRKNK
jgi:hypothetical protein